MARVSVLGGVGEIGGNKILVEDKDARVMLDFGMSISQRARFFSDPYVSPRRPESLLSLGIIPRIEGVYSWDSAEKKVDAIFLSHAHLDHYGYLSMVHRDVPCTAGRRRRGSWPRSPRRSAHRSRPTIEGSPSRRSGAAPP